MDATGLTRFSSLAENIDLATSMKGKGLRGRKTIKKIYDLRKTFRHVFGRKIIRHRQKVASYFQQHSMKSYQNKLQEL